jgi:hypothetical protein
MTALYLAWKETIRKAGGKFYVNLACNRDAPEARVVSFLPEQGRLTVVPEQEGAFYVRVPGFVRHDEVGAWRGVRRAGVVSWEGDYVAFERARKGEELTVTYPLAAFEQKVHRGGRDYTLYWNGNALTRLEPRDGTWPLFAKIPCATPPFTPFKSRSSGSHAASASR